MSCNPASGSFRRHSRRGEFLPSQVAVGAGEGEVAGEEEQRGVKGEVHRNDQRGDTKTLRPPPGKRGRVERWKAVQLSHLIACRCGQRREEHERLLDAFAHVGTVKPEATKDDGEDRVEHATRVPPGGDPPKAPGVRVTPGTACRTPVFAAGRRQ